MGTVTPKKGETLEERMIRHEGLQLKPYKDTEGFWTIGIGHKLKDSEALVYRNGITTDFAFTLFHDDVDKHRTALYDALPWVRTCSPLRQEVFVELAFNLGLHGLLGFHRTLTYAEDGLWTRCSTEILLSKWATQVKGRAVELAQLLREG